MPCSAYYNKYPFSVPLTSIFSQSYSIVPGYNKFLLSWPMSINRGMFVYLIQTSGQVAIDTTTNSSYSDMVLNNGAYYKLNDLTNVRLYLNAITNFTTYTGRFNLVHTYSSFGLYNLKISFESSNDVLYHSFNVTQCKFKIRLFQIIFIKLN